MKMLLAVAILLAATTAAASAAPTKLAELQLDNVTAAGHVPVDPPPVNGHPWHPGGPPVFHPILFCFGGRCTSGH
jgi:hypothetical protein